jgi:hypothetical protein
LAARATSRSSVFSHSSGTRTVIAVPRMIGSGSIAIGRLVSHAEAGICAIQPLAVGFREGADDDVAACEAGARPCRRIFGAARLVRPAQAAERDDAHRIGDAVAVIGDVQEVLGAGAVQRERDAGRTGAARAFWRVRR